MTPGAHGGHSPGMSSQLPLSLHLSLPASSLLLLELTSQINYLHPCPHLRLCSRGGSRERPSSLPGMWSEALTSAGTEHRVFQHPIRSHAHPAPHMDRARRPAGPRTCPDGPVSEDRAGDLLRPALELSAESRLPCNVGKRWFVCGGGSDGGEQSPALRRAGPPRGSMGSHRLGRCTDSALARRS